MELRQAVQRHIENARFKEAKESMETLQESWKFPFRLLMLQTQIAMGSKDYRGAAHHIETALGHVPQSIEAKNLEAILFLKMGDKQKYDECIESSIKLAEVHLNNLLHWGDTYLDQGKTGKSSTAYAKVLEGDSTNSRAAIGLLANNLLEGKRNVKPPDGVTGVELARSFNLRGIAMVSQGNFKVAEKLYQNSMAMLNDTSVAFKLWLNLGPCMKKKGDLDKAVDYFEKCDRIAPEGFDRAKAQIKQIENQKAVMEEQNIGTKKNRKAVAGSQLNYSSFPSGEDEES